MEHPELPRRRVVHPSKHYTMRIVIFRLGCQLKMQAKVSSFERCRKACRNSFRGLVPEPPMDADERR
jgi:hypothetical protein